MNRHRQADSQCKEEARAVNWAYFASLCQVNMILEEGSKILISPFEQQNRTLV